MEWLRYYAGRLRWSDLGMGRLRRKPLFASLQTKVVPSLFGTTILTKRKPIAIYLIIPFIPHHKSTENSKRHNQIFHFWRKPSSTIQAALSFLLTCSCPTGGHLRSSYLDSVMPPVVNPSSLKPFSQTYSLKDGVRWTPLQGFRYAWTDRLEIWHECQLDLELSFNTNHVTIILLPWWPRLIKW